MAVIIETTGLAPVVVIKSLGAMELTHPTTLDLHKELKNRDDEIYGNAELIALQDEGLIVLQNSNGDDINVSQPLGSTVGSMESFAEVTLSGNYIVDVDSERNLYIDPGAADRDIIFPDHSEMIGKTFNIYHVGSANRRLFIKEVATTIATVRRRKAVEIKASSEDFIIYEFGTSVIAQ